VFDTTIVISIDVTTYIFRDVGREASASAKLFACTLGSGDRIVDPVVGGVKGVPMTLCETNINTSTH
jgi:hypothetical protein